MNRDVFIFVNGILTRPGEAFAWTDRAVQWMNLHAADGVVSDKFEYYAPALLRRLYQRGHADDLAETIAQYPGARLHLVGHSNGCDLIARAVRLTSTPIASVHLIAAALERDFAKNGLGERLARGQIGAAYCLCSRGDMVLGRLARATQLLGFLGLGYGDLGGRGPFAPEAGQLAAWRVRTIWRNTLGHSDWFSPAEFERTLSTVLTQSLHP